LEKDLAQEFGGADPIRHVISMLFSLWKALTCTESDADPADLDVMIAAIVDELAANLVARNSIGHIGAAQLLLTAGDNPERLRSEASFASLCGVSPVPASSGKTVRHRLNRGGDRAAFAQYLAPSRKVEWVVYSKRPF